MNGVAPVSPSMPRKRTRNESIPATAHVTIADSTLFGFAATFTPDTATVLAAGARPSRQAPEQTSAMALSNERFIIRPVAHGAATGVGTLVVVRVPLPSSASALTPQQYARPLSRAMPH